MDLQGLGLITVLGAVMALAGAIFWIRGLVRYRRTQRALDENQTGDSESPGNTFAAFWAANGMLHIGMLLLILGGIGLIYYGQR